MNCSFLGAGDLPVLDGDEPGRASVVVNFPEQPIRCDSETPLKPLRKAGKKPVFVRVSGVTNMSCTG